MFMSSGGTWSTVQRHKMHATEPNSFMFPAYLEKVYDLSREQMSN